MKTEVMQLVLWWTAGKETWSVQLDSYTSHNVRRNNLNMGCFSLHTNNPYSERSNHCIGNMALLLLLIIIILLLHTQLQENT